MTPQPPAPGHGACTNGSPTTSAITLPRRIDSTGEPPCCLRSAIVMIASVNPLTTATRLPARPAPLSSSKKNNVMPPNVITSAIQSAARTRSPNKRGASRLT